MIVDHLRAEDAEALSRSHSDPDNARFQGWKSPLSVEEAAEFIAEQQGEDAVQYAIREEAGGPLAGDLSLARQDDGVTVEIGITLVPGFHGRGIATAAVRHVTETVAAERFVAHIDVDNERSRALFERVGFRLVGQADGEVEMELPSGPPR